MIMQESALEKNPDIDMEIEFLLEVIYIKFHYDFRGYTRASIKRRLLQALKKHKIASVSGLQEKVIHEPGFFGELLQYLTVPTSEMFRDPSYFLFLRRQVVPMLRTYPSVKIWIAGCSTGEEIYSFAILLKEEGLLDRCLIYATDINTRSLEKAQSGVFHAENLKLYTSNYQKAGGKRSFAEYYTAAYNSALLERSLIKNVVFADHNLATDSVFTEAHLISCRNVLIYFNRELQDRAFGLFRDSLVFKGFLGIGSKETVQFSKHAHDFAVVDQNNRVYQKVGTVEDQS